MTEANPTEPLTDWLGREFKEGDIVVYPGRRSSSMWMVMAEVVKVKKRLEPHWDRNLGGHIIREVPKLEVRVLRKSQGYGSYETLTGRKTTIEQTDRVTIVKRGGI